MAARDLVVRWLGEGVAQKIEQFVEGQIFGDSMVRCRQCKTPIAATFLAERKECQVCGARATKEMLIEALEAQKRTLLAAGSAVEKEVEEIDKLLVLRKRE